jgi:hypothetical protein
MNTTLHFQLSRPAGKAPAGFATAAVPPDSPFHWRDNPRPSIFAQDNSVMLSIRQSTVVDKEREKGHDVSHLPGLTTKEQRIVNLR